MKKSYLLFAGLLMLVAALQLQLYFNSVSVDGLDEAIQSAPVGSYYPDEGNSITVNGEGSIKVVPDTGYISIGVTEKNKDLDIVQESTSKKMDAIVNILKAKGIDEKDIQTTSYNINPVYNWDTKTNLNNLEGYEIYFTLRVTVKELSDMGGILTAVTKEGSNLVSGISFGVSDESKAYNDALTAAVKNARSKAEAIAKTENLGKIKAYKITESSTYYEPYRDYGKYSGMDAAVESTSVPIEQGEMEISGTVLIEFKFEN